MSKVRSIQDGEIDLFRLLLLLWDGKWLIIAFLVIGILVGSGLILSKDPSYESELSYSPENIPPFYKMEKVKADFQNMFYSKRNFTEWKKSFGKTSLNYKKLSNNQVIDGFTVEKNKNQRFARLFDKNKDSYIIVKTNQLKILDDFFRYANYINDKMIDNYIKRGKRELKEIDSQFQCIASSKDSLSDESLILMKLKIDRYIISSENGAKAISVGHPSMPKKVSPKSFQILVLSILFGGIIGVVCVLARNVIRKLKKKII
jgi:LPS O-antigen subunit length determinant protein (WzzB/FepE family)